MNAFLGLDGYIGENQLYSAALRLSDIINPPPAKIFTFVDEHEDSINDPNFFNQNLDRGFVEDLPASRHNGAGTLAFADGHVETKKWQDERTRQPVRREIWRPQVMTENPDLYWLYERATQRLRY